MNNELVRNFEFRIVLFNQYSASIGWVLADNRRKRICLICPAFDFEMFIQSAASNMNNNNNKNIWMKSKF